MFATENLEVSLIQHNNLSKKDQLIKDKLFAKKPPAQSVKNANPPHKPEKPQQTSFSRSYETPSESQIDGFLKNMQEEFKKTNESTFFPT